VCANFAVHAEGAITFAATAISGGDVSGGAAISGGYENSYSSAVGDSAPFDPDSVTAAWNAAMDPRDGTTTIPAGIGGEKFTPGTYYAATISMAAGETVTLDGLNGDNPVFLFQAGSTMLTGAGCNMRLIRGAKVENILWALGTTLTTGADNDFYGSIIAGGAITFGATNIVSGNVVSKAAITFGANVPIDGCVVALGAMTYGAGCSVGVVQPVISTSASIDVVQPVISTSASTTSPSPEPTASPIAAATAALTATPTAAAAAPLPAPSCSSDVFLMRQIGGTSYTDMPITILQSSNTDQVIFKISQEWTENNLSYLFVRFKDDKLAYPNCHAFEQVNATWISEPLTAFCSKFSKITLVEIWVSDISLNMNSDIAVLPKCSCDPPDSLPMVKYVFQVECVSTCSSTSCQSTPSIAIANNDEASLPECIIDDEASLNDVCGSVAIHAHDTITFASGEKTRIVGDIGVSPGTSITGEFLVKPGGEVQSKDDSDNFAASMWGPGGSYELAIATREVDNYVDYGETLEIGGMTFTPGTYRVNTAINFAHGLTVTLDGEFQDNPVFLFQAGTTFVTAADTYFILKNGAKAKNIIWALGTAATLGARSIVEGSILAGTAITFGTMSELRGCAIAQSAVTFESRGYVNVRKQTDSSSSSTCSDGAPGAPGTGVCGRYAVHARATITSAGTPNTHIKNGEMSVSPGTSITGNFDYDHGKRSFDSADFATSVMFNHADLRSRRDVETYWGVGAHEIGGMTFYPGNYRSGTAINFAHGTTVTLDGGGDPNSVFLFQAGSTLTTAADTYFILKNGANAKNIIWALGTAATLGARSVVAGSILAGTAITFGTDSKLYGCAIAMTAVTFETEGSVDLLGNP
jgi:hypothetical protein